MKAKHEVNGRCACGARTKRTVWHDANDRPPTTKPYRKCHVCSSEIWRLGMVKAETTMAMKMKAAIRKVKAGKTIEFAAFSTGVSPSTLAGRVEGLGGSRKGELRRGTAERHQRILELKAQGLRTPEISKAMGVGDRTVQKYLKLGHKWLH